jgi:hypothetical protein
MVTLSNVAPMMILPQLAARMATAMARSAAGPSLGRAAGTREMVVCADGQGRPLLRMPARTRSLVSGLADLVRAAGRLRPLEPPEAYTAVPRRCLAAMGRSAVRVDGSVNGELRGLASTGMTGPR